MPRQPRTAPAMEMMPATATAPAPRASSAYQLTPLWELVLRTRSLPPEVDQRELLTAVAQRLRDPEREVRQHALRVLQDLVPVLRPSMDAALAPLLPDLLRNLGHPAPAVRKGALDALRTYISKSSDKQCVIDEICLRCSEKNSINDKSQEDVIMGAILALPSLLQPALEHPGGCPQAIDSVMETLASKLFQVIYQEVAMRSLLRLKELIGKRGFQERMDRLDAAVGQNFKMLRSVYDLPGTPDVEGNLEDLGESFDTIEDDEKNIEKSEEMFISEPPSELLNDKNTKDLNDYRNTITVDMDETETIPNGKVILETEFTFDSDTAITMTILEEEESRTDPVPESEEESFDYTTYNKSVVKVLTDSEVDEYDEVRRTPRRVRFGGEIVKMRTPDSDTIQNSDADDVAEEKVKKKKSFGNSVREDGSMTVKKTDVVYAKDEKKMKKSHLGKSLIPLPVEPITSRPRDRRGMIEGESSNLRNRRKSKSLNDLSTYCKRRFGTTPMQVKSEMGNSYEKGADFAPLRKTSTQENLKSISLEEQQRMEKRNSFAASAFTDKFGVTSGGSQEDYSSGQSGNSSGSSSDNTLDDPLEELNAFNDEIFKDLYKMEGQRGALQVLDRLAARLSSPDFAQSLSVHQVHVLSTRLGALAGRARGRAGEAGAQALRALVRAAPLHALRGALPSLAGALAATGVRHQGLLADLGRRVPATDLVEVLLDETSPHWRSTKLRAGALRAVAHVARALPCSGVRVQWACSKCAACARSPRRRVRAAALEALAALACLCTPRAVLHAVHREAADHDDGDQLYDAVLARLCRPSVVGGAPAIGPSVGPSGGRRPDLAWVMAGRGDASPPPNPPHKFPRSREDQEWSGVAEAEGRPLAGDAPPLPPPSLQPSQHHRPSHTNTSCRPIHTGESRIPIEQHKWDSGGHRLSEGRVLTAPPLALRPLTLRAPVESQSQPPGAGGPWHAQAVLWAAHTPTATDMTWPQKQGSWPPLGGSWPQQHMQPPPQLYQECQQAGGGVPWTGPRPSMLRALSPQRHCPPQGRWGAPQGIREDGFSPHNRECQPHTSSESLTNRGHFMGSSNNLLRVQNKIEDTGDALSQKSDLSSSMSIRDVNKSPTGSTASLAPPLPPGSDVSHRSRISPNPTPNYFNHIPLSPNHVNHASPVVNHANSNHMSPIFNHKEFNSKNNTPIHRATESPSSQYNSNNPSPILYNYGESPPVPNQTQDKSLSSPFHNSNRSTPSPSRIQEPPTIDDDFDDDNGVNIMHSPQSRRSKMSANSEKRFINIPQESDNNVIVGSSNGVYESEDRFINFKPETPTKDVLDRVSVTSAKFSLKENLSRSATHSIKSNVLSSPTREERTTPKRAVIASAPAPPISYLGSSVSTEEEVKSFESDSVKSFSSGDNGKTNGVVNDVGKIEKELVTKKPPKKGAKVLQKSLSTKFTKNKVQPLQLPVSILQPFDKPKEALSKSLAQMENSDWETVMTGIHSMECLVKYHPVYLESHLTPVTRAIASQVKNLRSQVARAACRLAGNLFLAQRKSIESEADELAVPLLSRTADTNKFLRSDANDALDKMCEAISTQKSISILITRGAVHQNAIVRCTSARLLGNIAENNGSDKIFGIQKETRDKLLQTGADLLTEGSLETRGYTKQLFRILTQNSQFLRTMREVIPLTKYRNIEKVLNNIRSK